MDCRYNSSGLKIFHSDHLLEGILKYLDLNEQIQLARVNERFEEILIKLLWPKMYADVTLYKTRHSNFLISSNNESNKIDNGKTLSEVMKPKVSAAPENVKYFLNKNFNNIIALKLNSEYYSHVNEIYYISSNIQIFRNLTELSFFCLIISDSYLQVVARKCKKLKILHLVECKSDHLDPLIPGDNVNLDSIFEMKQLEELVVQNATSELFTIQCSTIQDIFENLKLRKLILKNFCVACDDDIPTRMDAINKTYEVIDIGVISKSFKPLFVLYLMHFDNIKEIFINFESLQLKFGMRLMHILSQLELEKLTISNCTIEIDEFSGLKHLKYLSLNNCDNLTFMNLQQILRELTLKTFIMNNVYFSNDLADLYLAPSLQELFINTKQYSNVSYAFKKSCNEFENLHTLTWGHGDIRANWLINKCPELKYLHLSNIKSFGLIGEMKFLKELKLTTCMGLSWFFLSWLIHNLKLKYLYLGSTVLIENDNEYLVDDCPVKTTLQMIHLELHLFRNAQAFWLNLCDLNEDLHLLIYGKFQELLDIGFLKSLIKSNIFGNKLKFIRICGIKFDCLDMQKDFNRAIQDINKYTSYYRYKNANFTLEM